MSGLPETNIFAAAAREEAIIYYKNQMKNANSSSSFAKLKEMHDLNVNLVIEMFKLKIGNSRRVNKQIKKLNGMLQSLAPRNI